MIPRRYFCVVVSAKIRIINADIVVVITILLFHLLCIISVIIIIIIIIVIIVRPISFHREIQRAFVLPNKCC
jgi:Na+/H+ antiporter NhaC